MIIPITGVLGHLLNKSENLTFGVNEVINTFVSRHGNEEIRSMVLGKVPVAKATMGMMGVISPNFKNKNNFDDLYHVFVILITNKGVYKLEKVETLTVRDGKATLQKTPPQYKMEFPVDKRLTVYEMMDRTKKSMGVEKMRGYDAKKNNCMDFIMAMLRANGFYTDERKEFIKQETDHLFTDNLQKTANTITDIVREGVNPIVNSYVPKFVQDGMNDMMA